MSVIYTSIALSDAAMAVEIAKALAQVLVVVNGFTAVIATRATSSDPWTKVGRGDSAEQSAQAAKLLTRTNRIFWLQIPGSPADFDLAAASLSPGSASTIAAWLKGATTLTAPKGRGEKLKPAQESEFGIQCAWRCQFSGCGKDLMRQSATGVASKSSYFAHIIASFPGGPRGDTNLSHQYAADVSNYMLLCDECHRRIDREDPDVFRIDVLRKMREDSIFEVRRLLDSLQYKETIPVCFVGNITGQAPQIDWRDVEEGLWTRKLRMAPGLHPYRFLQNSWHQHDPHSPSYWVTLLEGLGGELSELKKLLNLDLGARDGKHFSILPLHGTSVLVLAGRLFGEAASTTVLQFRRQLPKLKWGVDNGVMQPAKFRVNRLRTPVAGDEEACLIVSVTFAIDKSRLSTSLFNDDFLLPALEITTDETLSSEILDRPENLDALSTAMSEAVRVLQDEWGMKKVHLVIGSPASGLFRFGQKLQARHHAVYICYESLPGGGSTPFLPTIEISSNEVRAVGAQTSLRLV